MAIFLPCRPIACPLLLEPTQAEHSTIKLPTPSHLLVIPGCRSLCHQDAVFSKSCVKTYSAGFVSFEARQCPMLGQMAIEHFSKEGVRYVRGTYHSLILTPIDSEDSVHFPGALSSKFTTELSFVQPSSHPAMPTYRVMDSDGVIVDAERNPQDVSREEIVSWYKNMLTGNDRLDAVVSLG